MSQILGRRHDPFYPEMEYGLGRWPSFQYAEYVYVTGQLFGQEFPHYLSPASMYGCAFQYADSVFHDGKWTGGAVDPSKPEALDVYIDAVRRGEESLRFTVFVPKGYGIVEEKKLPNVQETEDPELVFTADFNNSQEVWV